MKIAEKIKQLKDMGIKGFYFISGSTELKEI
jgi:hypothetical protein